MKKIQIVFVCLGNYCRSPMAEAIFNKIVHEDGYSHNFDVSSAGTKDWDVGLSPDPRSRAILEQHGYPLAANKRAQMISNDQKTNADFLIAMTQEIADELGCGDNILLLLDFSPISIIKDIPDPYPTDTFPQAFSLIEEGIKYFYSFLKENQAVY